MRQMWLKNRKCFYVAAVCCMLIAGGCKKLVQVDEPNDSMTSTEVFSNDSLAQAAINGIYIKMMSSTKFLLCGAMSVFPSLSADEMTRFFPMANEEQFSSNAIVASNQLINVNIWKAAYAYIYQCNICIEGLSKSAGVNADLKKRLTGEVKFVRALCYYYLVNLYGGIPLVLGTNAEVNAMLPRTPDEQIYNQIEADLIASNDALSGVIDNTQPTSFAANALLARVYLHRKDWNKAEEYASRIINSGLFALENDLSEVFKNNSKEIIFQLAPVQPGMNSPEGFLFVPSGSGRPSYSVSKELWESFESGDLRKDAWIRLGSFSGQQYKIPNKYKTYLSAPGVAPTEYNVVMRLAEQYLICAEAKANQGRIQGAVQDINFIRNRAGLSLLATTINSEECFRAIEQERRTELFTEWGHRWIDLKRTNRADAVLSSKASGWQHNDRLYPIPFVELETAPNLVQNPGYE